MSIMLCNAILTNRYVGTDAFFILGGTLTSPFIFILDDIIAEIYGYKIARYIILSGFAAQTLFIIICQFIVIAPYPSHFKESAAYINILGPTLLHYYKMESFIKRKKILVAKLVLFNIFGSTLFFYRHFNDGTKLNSFAGCLQGYVN